MADSKLTGLGQIGTPADSDIYYVVQSGTSYYVTRTDMLEVEDTPADGNTTRPISSNWAYDHANGADPHTVYLLKADIDDVPVDAETAAPISSNWAYDHENAADPHSVYLLVADIDDTPVDAETSAPISSNWAYDHENAADPHNVYPLAAGTETISGAWTFTADATFSLNAIFSDAIIENVYALSGTEINPENGTIQTKTLSTNTTFTYGAGFDAGMSVTLMLDVAGTYTVTWPTTNWAGGSAPTLTSNGSNEYDVIVITKIGTQYYGKYIGMFT